MPVFPDHERAGIRDGGNRPRGTVEIQELADAAAVQVDERPKDPASFCILGARCGAVQRIQNLFLRQRLVLEDLPYLPDRPPDSPRADHFFPGTGKSSRLFWKNLFQKAKKIVVRGMRKHMERDHRKRGPGSIPQRSLEGPVSAYLDGNLGKRIR